MFFILPYLFGLIPQICKGTHPSDEGRLGPKKIIRYLARVVNTLLQCLDEFECDSIFIAATNLQEELDNAVWRRFDTKMHYSMPNDESRKEYLHLLLKDFEQEDQVMERASYY